jgi:hypothetical protein
VLGLIEALRRLPRSRLLDRLIQGRISIALVAFALIGIVTMQLGLLKLNAGIGRALEHESLLQRENATLSIENSEMAAGDRVELHAGRLGMELISPGALRFLAIGDLSLEASRGAAALRDPIVTAVPGAATSTPGGTTGEISAGTVGSEAASGASGEVSSASGEASGEASSATPASSASPSAAPASEVTAPAAPAGVATAAPANVQSGGSSEAPAAPSAPTGGGAPAPSG